MKNKYPKQEEVIISDTSVFKNIKYGKSTCKEHKKQSSLKKDKNKDVIKGKPS